MRLFGFRDTPQPKHISKKKRSFVCCILTWGMLTTTLLLATLATRISPCWMILWPWTWTLGTDALGASKSGGGPELLCCCCRRLANCWGVIAICWWQHTHAEAAITRSKKWEIRVLQIYQLHNNFGQSNGGLTHPHTNLSSSNQGWHDNLGVVFGLDVLPTPNQRRGDHCAWAPTRHL